jgi:hypothetical protein
MAKGTFCGTPPRNLSVFPIMAIRFSTTMFLVGAVLATLSAAQALTASKDVIIKPLVAGLSPVGVFFIQGASIDAEAYVPLAQVVQQGLANNSLSAWVGIPSFLGDIAEPAALEVGITRVQHLLQAAGLPASAPLFVVAHSLGGATIQIYTEAKRSMFKGQVLLGAFLLRLFLNGTTNNIPTLTVGGELDGLSRVSRIAESYYHQILHPRGQFTRNATLNYPVTVVRGMSHMQFASGTPPAFVKEKDFRPEISYEAAHAIVATDVCAFILVQLGGSHASDAAATLQKRSAQSGEFFAPLIAGFEMEGSSHVKPPCNDEPVTDACLQSCPWTRMAQVILGGVSRPGLSFNVSDEFHVVSDIHPVHLPHVLNQCTNPSPDANCTLLMTTVSQNMYEVLDEADTGVAPVSASEIRAKLKSRQVVYEATGLPADFNKTDTPSLCAEINSHALAWAYAKADPLTLARYQRIGEPYALGEDLGPYNAGPLWIGAPVVYKNTTSASGQPEVLVRSPMMRTPSKYIVPAAAGMHYCKMLSPSRALEWIYVDSLRLRGGL